MQLLSSRDESYIFKTGAEVNKVWISQIFEVDIQGPDSQKTFWKKKMGNFLKPNTFFVHKYTLKFSYLLKNCYFFMKAAMFLCSLQITILITVCTVKLF